MKIGVLALQGAFIEHEAMLRRLGVDVVEVRLPRDLDDVVGVIIPGGESTTMGKLAVKYHLMEPLRELARSGKALWGTCAGMIFMAKNVGREGRDQPVLGVMDVRVQRNAFGRQVDSFEADLNIKGVDGDKLFHAIFIRAPLIEAVGEGVDVLARVEKDKAEVIVAARQGNLLVTSFHPELSNDDRFHRYFVKMAESKA